MSFYYTTTYMTNLQIVLIGLMLVLTSCNSSLDVQDLLSLNDDEMLVVKRFSDPNYPEELTSILIVNGYSENYDSLTNILEKPFNWTKNKRSLSRPKYLIQGTRLKLYVYGDHLVIVDQNGFERLSQTKIVEELGKLQFDEYSHEFNDFYGLGELRTDNYMICSTFPILEEYEYKSGYWKFYGKDYKLIGEGEMQIRTKNRANVSGCDSIEIRFNKLERINWNENLPITTDVDSLLRKFKTETPIKYNGKLSI